ncbi:MULTISPECIES: hypothetical protein [unclassified Bradyrhizobium]|nr:MULTISPECIES: hypothetical protein [unclassified Bradyrhizobium]
MRASAVPASRRVSIHEFLNEDPMAKKAKKAAKATKKAAKKTKKAAKKK